MTQSHTDNEQEKNERCSPTKREFIRSMMLNAWLALSAATYIAGVYLIRSHPAASPAVKAAFELMPVIPGILFLRNGIQLLRELDELQRRIQIEALLFAAFGTVVIGTVINVFNSQGLVGVWPPDGLEVGGAYITMFFLWSVSSSVGKLRYR